MRAALTLPLAKCIDATTEQPMPSISPIPVNSNIKGITRFTAAIPSFPNLWPTNTPSTVVATAMFSMPISVGIKYFLNNRDTFTVPKSILSLSILGYFILILVNRLQKYQFYSAYTACRWLFAIKYAYLYSIKLISQCFRFLVQK